MDKIHPEYDLAWKISEELRKEILTTQQIRAQTIGFKITFVSAAIGLIASHGTSNGISMKILAVPAFLAIFFDLLINSYSVSIAEKGFYIRTQIEPILKRLANWPECSDLWEGFLSKSKIRSRLALIGNLGLTGLAVAATMVALAMPFDLILSIPVGILLIILFIYDIKVHFRSREVRRSV
jgi:hypothetical protein